MIFTSITVVPAGSNLTYDFGHASWRHPALFATSQAGLVTNLKDGAWRLFPLFFSAAGLSFSEIRWT